MSNAPRFTVEETAPGCLAVDMDAIGSDWEQWFLLRSDAHHDNAHADHRLELLHLTDAEDRNAGVLDAGDLFCAMQGKWDRRADTSQCRPEHREGRYLDSLVETAAEFYEPFAERWILMAPGNHESSIVKRHETDLTDRLVERMRAKGAPHLYRGRYSGFVRFRAMLNGTSRQLTLYYHHGHGGGGPMSHGVLTTRRMQSYLPDADIIWSGHTHDSWTVRLARARLSRYGSPYIDTVHHVKTPGYKEEFRPLEGWHIERGAPPKPLGAVWMRLFLRGHDRVLTAEFTEAT